MKRLIFSIVAVFLFINIAYGQVYSPSKIYSCLSTDTYVDLRCKTTIALADTLAQSLGKSLVCASTYTLISAVTVTSPASGVQGCMFHCGSGSINFKGGFTAPDGVQVFASDCTAGKVTGMKEATPEMWGCKGNGTVNCTPSMQSAVEALYKAGTSNVLHASGVLRVRSGAYLLADSGNDELVKIQDPTLQIIGDGFSSVFLVSAGVPSTTDIFHFVPNIASLPQDYAGLGLTFKDFSIYPAYPFIGSSYGRHGISIETTDDFSGGLRKALIDHVNIQHQSYLPPETGASNGRAIKIINSAGNDTGTQGITISNSFLRDGIELVRGGDSNIIENNTIRGANNGIDVDMINGSAQLVIEKNNITSNGSSINIISGIQISILRNQLEHPYADASTYHALVNLERTVGRAIRSTILKNNNINPQGNMNYAVRIGNLGDDGIDTKVYLDNNFVTSGTVGKYSIVDPHSVFYTSLANTETTTYNIALGDSALSSNPTGSYDIGIGISALKLNVGGNYNVGIGGFSLAANIDGSNDVSIGLSSQATATNANYNTSMGNNSLQNNKTTGNTCAGYACMSNLTTGSGYNTGIGVEAGRFLNDGTTANTNPTLCVYLGYGARALNNNDSNEIVIGNTALGYGTNTVTLGNDSIAHTYLKGVVHYTPASAISSTPTFTGQFAVVGTDAYIATGITDSTYWKKITP